MNKEKLLENTRRYRKTKKGVLTNMYNHIKLRHKTEFTLKEFHNRFLDDKKYNRLFNEWVKKGYVKQLKPSLDRINNNLNYTVENTQMITWAENRFKQSAYEGKKGRKPRVIQMIDDKIIKIFHSQRHCVKELGISQGNLSNVLNGKREHVNGYKFVYENPDLLTKENK